MTERAGVQGNPVTRHAIPAAEPHPHAGGPGHYAAYLANTDAFEVELVATEPCPAP